MNKNISSKLIQSICKRLQTTNVETPFYYAGYPIYLDYMSTSPVDPRVTESMLPFLYHKFGNPHSNTHSYGRDNYDCIETARKQIADSLSCDPKEIIFTSGATESNNLAIKGVVEFLSHSNPNKNHIITSVIEHKCILETCRQLELKGYKVDYLKVDAEGRIDLEEFESKITENTIMASFMYVNNEIGAIQEMNDIGKICKNKKILLHSDAAQAYCKVPIDVNKLNVDLMSITSHKVYGPKGVGAIYIRRKPKRVRLSAQIAGGGQERGFRSGTLAPHQVVGFGEAAKIFSEEGLYDYQHVQNLSKVLMKGIDDLGLTTLNGAREESRRYPGVMNYSFEFIEGESLLMSLRNVALSSGSACTSESLEPSYVLRALGIREELHHNSIRFSVGRFTTKEQVEMVLKLLHSHIPRLREMSPLYEMWQDGVDMNQVDWDSPK